MRGAHGASGETAYGWVVVFASLALHSVSLGAPTMLFVALKPIAADLETARAIPSLAYSLMMVGAGIGGIAMGWWMDRLGVMQPVLFGSVMICLGALLASRAEGPVSLFIASGVLIGLFGKAAMIAPLVANVTRCVRFAGEGSRSPSSPPARDSRGQSGPPSCSTSTTPWAGEGRSCTSASSPR